jgi:hypothetical protein
MRRWIFGREVRRWIVGRMNGVSVALGWPISVADYLIHGPIRGDEAVGGMTRRWSVYGQSDGLQRFAVFSYLDFCFPATLDSSCPYCSLWSSDYALSCPFP